MADDPDSATARADPPPGATFAPRKPWVAAVLSLVEPGLGQLYAGRWQRALTVWLLTASSRDSRHFGFVPVENVLGRVVQVYWSWEEAREETADGRNAGGTVRWARIGKEVY